MLGDDVPPLLLLLRSDARDFVELRKRESVDNRRLDGREGKHCNQSDSTTLGCVCVCENEEGVIIIIETELL